MIRKFYRRHKFVPPPSRLGALFFMIMNQVLINLAAVDLFIRDKALFM